MQRWNTPSKSVSQPHTASRPARSPSASTAGSPSVLVQQTSHLRSASGSACSRSRGRSPSHSTSKPRPKRAPSEDYGTLPSEREGGQHYRSTDLPIYGIGMSHFLGSLLQPNTLNITIAESYPLLPTRRALKHPVGSICFSFTVLFQHTAFLWVSPVTVVWGETSGCATLWGCSMVHRGKNIVNW